MQTRLETCEKKIESRAEHVFFSLVPVIMDEVKRVKIVVTDTAYDFYMRKGTDKDQCFYLYRGEGIGYNILRTKF